MVVIDVCKAQYYSITNINNDRNLKIRIFAILLVKDMLDNLDSKFSPYYVLINLPYLGMLPEGDKGACLWILTYFPVTEGHILCRNLL